MVELSKKHLPQLSACLEDPRVEILLCPWLPIPSGNKGQVRCHAYWTPPVPVGRVAEHLTKEFYQDIYTALRG